MKGQLVLFLFLLSIYAIMADDGKYCQNLRSLPLHHTSGVNPRGVRSFPVCIGKDPNTNEYESRVSDQGWHIILTDLSNKYDYVSFEKASRLIEGGAFGSYLSFYYLTDAKSGKQLERRLYLAFSFKYYMSKNNLKKIEGIYIQGISGPGGLPFGRFMHANFDEDHRTAQKYPRPDNDQQNFHNCTYRPNMEGLHPGVYLYKEMDSRNSITHSFGTVFAWVESKCWQTSFFQFLVIVVFSFSEAKYIPMVSLVVKPEALTRWPELGGNEPLPNSLLVGDRVTFTEKGRIIPNLDFENCIRLGVGRFNAEGGGFICHPREFKCDVDEPTQQQKEGVWPNWREVYSKFKEKRPMCNVVYVKEITTTTVRSTTSTTTVKPTTSTSTVKPTTSTSTLKPTTSTSTVKSTTSTSTLKPTTSTSTLKPTTSTSTVKSTTSTSDLKSTSTVIPTTAKPIVSSPKAIPSTTEHALFVFPDETEPPPTPSTPMERLTQYTQKLAERIEIEVILSHGDIGVYVWFVLTPPVNYISRYFKDSPNVEKLHLGYWIIIHVVMHHLGALLLWYSLGLVVSDGYNIFGGATGNMHLTFGIGAMLVQASLLFSSMWPRNVKPDEVRVLKEEPSYHVPFGYIGQALSFACICYSNHVTLAKVGIVGTIILISFAAFMGGMLIEWRVERYYRIFPPRRHYPELEPIEIRGKSPYRYYKILWFTLYVVSVYGLYFIYVYAF